MGTSVSKASVAIRAFGKAFGFIGRIMTPGPISFKWKKKKSGDTPVKHNLSQRDTIELEIDKVERRLDTVYRRIAQGATLVRQDKTGAGSAELDDLLKLSHELKDDLRAKRLELSRLERHTARSVRFQLSVASRAEQDIELEERKEPKQDLPEVRSHIGPKLTRAIQSAAKKASFADDSKQIMFENIIRDILEGDAELRRAAVANLTDIKGSSACRVLTLLLDDPDHRVCAAALNSLSVIGEPVPASLFMRFIDSQEDYLRLAALRGLARLGRSQDAVVFVNHLEDRHPAIRKAAATYLGWRREKSAIRRLIRALYDIDENVRSAAATALGHIRDDRAVMSLIRTLGDDDASVRRSSKAAIETILNEKFDIDVDVEDPKNQIEAIKDWWRSVRIDKQLAIRSAGFEATADASTRDGSNFISDVLGELGRNVGALKRRTPIAEIPTEVKNEEPSSVDAEQARRKSVEQANYRQTENTLQSVSRAESESPFESEFIADTPQIESEKPNIAAEANADRAATDKLERRVESSEFNRPSEREMPSQADMTSKEGLENEPTSAGAQDAFESSTRFDFDETQNPADGERPDSKSEEPFYQKPTDDSVGFGEAFDVKEAGGDVKPKDSEQRTERDGVSVSRPAIEEADETKTAEGSDSDALPEEQGVQDFGLDGLGIKVADEDQKSPAQADDAIAEEEEKDESESGDNEEYDFLLDS